jgi:hypothetical protein
MMLPAFPYAQPVNGLVGGLLIGLAAALMLIGAGRIAGVSGIAARATGMGGGNMSLSSAWSFLLGLPLGAALATLAIEVRPTTFPSWPTLVVAGLLVGFGTRLGSGCTSGHGVCGVSRLSQRSLLATATFMVSGIATVLIARLTGGAW